MGHESPQNGYSRNSVKAPDAQVEHWGPLSARTGMLSFANAGLMTAHPSEGAERYAVDQKSY